MDDPDRPLKDYGSFVHVQPSEADIAGILLFSILMNVFYHLFLIFTCKSCAIAIGYKRYIH